MGISATECRWIGWQFLWVILALKIGRLQLGVEARTPLQVGVEARTPLQVGVEARTPLQVGVEARTPLPHSLQGTPPLPSPLPPLPSQLPSTPALSPAVSELQQLMDQLGPHITSITSNFEKNYSDCFVHSDVQSTFDSSRLTQLLAACMVDETADVLSRVCGKAEIGAYFGSIASVLPPNDNCNAGNWPSACKPGWAAALALDYTLPTDTSTIPVRVTNALPCCTGFFCPGGLTCMIPCPMGAYCPQSVFNPFFFSCDPYEYSSKAEGVDCGGADVWSKYNSAATGIFCGAGSTGEYCPDSGHQVECEKGHFCRVGATAPIKCNILGHCTKPGSKQENLKTSGTLIAVLLFVSLVVIYTFSDKVLQIRERRNSRARDIAAREARERVSAAERWKRAKDVAKSAKKKAMMISRQLTRTLSRTLSPTLPKGYNSPEHGVSAEDLPLEERPLSVGNPDSSAEFHASADARAHLGWAVGNEELGKREPVSDLYGNASQSAHDEWSSDLYPTEGPRCVDLYESVELPPVLLPSPSLGVPQKGADGLPAIKEVGEVRGSWRTLAQTRSQIYKYAYGQIEKEKAKQQQQSNKPLSVKEMLESEGFMRPKRLRIELSFVDLSLVLKGSGKKILSYVTGKLSPCRVTAVMGPSGAGKTTFLNALAGKETGSVITGQVFINGVPGSIQAYRRIIGFVPQDDIVHGSLTVEENLSFSAKYRLPVGTPRQDRVLVVERIINRLNLTSIRDSLVGTVENRGISGGQRKRVNVGLELVIEPSLLILDEPTSGLDSTSSRLVLQALRREAALGVNVALVIHQPSYGLFQMFDDVMLLAKGGFTVYLGPITEIEAYFSSYGFEVPDRMNPPDYYMDVLEGVTTPSNDPSFDVKSLPVLWMCHNGHHIPLELQETRDAGRIERGDPSGISYSAPKSLIHELWDELRVWALVRWDILMNDMFSVKNLSGRQTPGFISQYFLILKRVTRQRFRESRLVAQDYIILLLAGICLAFLANWQDVTMGGQGYLYTLITVALLVMIASMRTFTIDKLQFWRESSSGINRLAYFLAKDTVDHFNTLLKPAVFLSMFYFYNDPRSTIASNYIATLVLIYCCTGISYIVAIIMNPQPGQLVCVFLPIIATLLVTSSRSGVLKTVQRLAYTFWALQAYTVANAERYAGVWLITRCETVRKYGYNIHNFNRCVIILLGYGMGARILAFLCLVLFHRKRQK